MIIICNCSSAAFEQRIVRVSKTAAIFTTDTQYLDFVFSNAFSENYVNAPLLLLHIDGFPREQLMRMN